MSLCSRDPAGRNVAESPAASPALASVPLPVAACVLGGWLAQAVESLVSSYEGEVAACSWTGFGAEEHLV